MQIDQVYVEATLHACCAWSGVAHTEMQVHIESLASGGCHAAHVTRFAAGTALDRLFPHPDAWPD